MDYVIVFVVGLLAGGALSYLYASSVIADYKDAAHLLGIEFRKIAGRIQAIKKAL